MQIESFLFIVWVAFIIFFNIFCFTFFPIKIVKNKKLSSELKGVVIGMVLGLWIWLEDCDFFMNIGGSSMERIEAINDYTGLPALLVLIVFFSVLGLTMGALASLLIRLLIKQKSIK